MAQNITLLGANYSDVPGVDLPKTGGGTARFMDVSDTTATASDVASGKYFYSANGVRTAGTGSGGGSAAIIHDTTDAAGGTVREIITDEQIELVSLEATENGTYNAPSGKAYESVEVNVSGGSGMNVQADSDVFRTSSASWVSTGISVTVAKTGTYKVSWMAWVSSALSSAYNAGTRLNVNGTNGTIQSTFTDNFGQHIVLTNQHYNAGDVLTLYANAYSAMIYLNVGNLIIEQTA